MRFFSSASHNVRTTYAFTFFFNAAQSILFQQVLSGYVFVLSNSNQPVGIVKGIQGISQLVSTVPAALLADRSRRDTVLRIAGVLGIVGAGITLMAVENCTLSLLYVAFGIWGLFAAFQSPAMEALFADSVPHGKRSLPFTINYNICNLALVLGPLASIVLFWHFGNTWRLDELQPVLAVGVVMALIAAFILFRFNDDFALTDEHSNNPFHAHAPLRSDSMQLRTSIHTPSIIKSETGVGFDFSDQEDDEIDNLIEEGVQAALGHKGSANHPVSESSPLVTATVQASNAPADASFMCFHSHHVPFLLFFSDFIIANGAGMTVNFFPLFFMQEYGFSPIQVSLLFVFEPLCIMVLSFVAQRMSRTCGRMPIVCATRCFATGCLLLMSYVQPMHLQVAMFLLRSGMMRCSQPLRRSVLMDHVDRRVRARWNALEGVTVFSWSGSAMIGGYLLDQLDYRTCFFITALVYMVGLALELFLLPLTKHAIEH